MIENIMLQSLLFIIICFLAVAFHELGHLFTIRFMGVKGVRLHYNKRDLVVGGEHDLDGLSDKQLFKVYFFGVLAGAIPIFIFCIHVFWLYQVGLLVAYVAGCRHDLKFLSRNAELDCGD